MKRSQRSQSKTMVISRPGAFNMADAMRTERHWDGWENMATGLGELARDKAMSVRFLADKLDDRSAEELWRGDDLAGRIVEAEPDEMLREGYEFMARIPGESGDEKAKELAESLSAKMSDLMFDEMARIAMRNERAKGGGAILIGAIDGQTDLSKPLNLKGLVDVKALNFLPKEQLWPREWQRDPMLPGLNTVSMWNLWPRQAMFTAGGSMARPIHASRLLVFPGLVISEDQVIENRGWGDSVLNRVYRVLRGFNASWGGAESLLSDFAVATLKLKGLAELVARNKDDVVVKRARQIAMGRSIAGLNIIDATEELVRQTTNLGSLPDIMDRFANRLAAAADMPVTLLMGQAPAGLNATGASDIRFYYDRIAARQRQRLLPHLNRMVKLLLLCKTGPTRGKEPEKWDVRFRPLYQMTEAEMVTMRYQQAQTDEIYWRMGAVTEDEVAVSRFGGPRWSSETVVDFEAREQMAKSKAEEEPAPPKSGPPAPSDAPPDDDGEDGVPPPKPKGKAKGDAARRKAK